VIVALLALPSTAPAETAPRRDLRRTLIADGVYQFTVAADGYVEQLNSVAVINAHDVLVFDTSTRPSDARAILSEIRKLSPRPVRAVVNSHWHPDHWSGNEVYAAAFPDLDIIATEETLEYMRNAAPAWPNRFKLNVARGQAELDKAIASGQNPDGTPFTAADRARDEAELLRYRDFAAEAATVKRTYPTLTYRDALTLRRGGREIRLISVTGDARGTTVMYLPKERVLVTGDVVVYPVPYSTPSPSQRIKDLRMLRALEVDVLIPGHGPAMRDKAYLDLTIELLESVVTQVRAALHQGAATLDDVRKRVDVSALRQRFARGDKALEARFDGHVREGLIPQAIREAREQDYRP
jgi:glyoxylase-like metal-dependent hydrolase (beta-lactamase superfamily II)